MWRVANSPLSSGLAEVEEYWTICDVLDANEFLDVAEDTSNLYRGAIAPQKEDSTGPKKQSETDGFGIEPEWETTEEEEIARVNAFSSRAHKMTQEEMIAELEKALDGDIG